MMVLQLENLVVGYPVWKLYGITIENPDRNSKVFSFGTSEVRTLSLIDNKMIGVADSSILGK